MNGTLNRSDLESKRLMWAQQEETVKRLPLDEDNARRVGQAFMLAWNAIDPLIESEQRVKANPDLSPAGQEKAIRAAMAKAAPAADKIRSLANEYIAKDIEKLIALPPRPQSNDAPEIVERRAEEIRRRLGDLDPLSIRDAAWSAVASEDMETLYALTAASPTAYPKIVQAFDADTRRDLALEIRSSANPALKQQVEDLLTLQQTLDAIANDLGRLTGGPSDELERMAAGDTA